METGESSHRKRRDRHNSRWRTQTLGPLLSTIYTHTHTQTHTHTHTMADLSTCHRKDGSPLTARCVFREDLQPRGTSLDVMDAELCPPFEGTHLQLISLIKSFFFFKPPKGFTASISTPYQEVERQNMRLCGSPTESPRYQVAQNNQY